jgi:hypothetical protein
MALSKTGSRLIVVDDVTYRWTVAGTHSNPGLWSMVGEQNHGRYQIVVEAANKPGQKLVRWADFVDVIICPGHVRQVIIQGLIAGWNPHQPGPEFRHGRPPER